MIQLMNHSLMIHSLKTDKLLLEELLGDILPSFSGTYSYGEFKILPRYEEDIILVFAPELADVTLNSADPFLYATNTNTLEFEIFICSSQYQLS